MKKFSDLSKEVQDYLNQRFEQHGMSAEFAFDETQIFSNEVKDLSDDNIISFLKKKDISHINPKSDFPNQSNDYENVFLEDYSINRKRGSEIASENEVNNAMKDQINDTKDLDVDEDGIVDIEDEDDIFDDILDFLF